MSFKEQREHEQAVRVATAMMDAEQARRGVMVQAHMKTLGDEQAEYSQMLITVVQAAVRKDGLVGKGGIENFALGCEALAHRLITGKRTKEWGEAKQLLEALNARNPSEVMVTAAKRAGVELSVALVPEPPKPKLVTEG